MEKVNLHNIEILLSDKLQNYVSDQLKALVYPGQMEVTPVVTLDKSRDGQAQGELSDQAQYQAKASDVAKAVIKESSEVVLEEDKGKLYECLLRDGVKKSVLQREKLLSILEEVKNLTKKTGAEDVSLLQVQTMPTDHKQFDASDLIEMPENEFLVQQEQEEEGEEHEGDEENEEEAEAEADRYVTLKQLRTKYFKID